MDRAEEFATKRERVERYMKANGLGGILLGRSDNFAWLGCGAGNVVNSAQETGVGGLVVQPGKVTLVANNIETERLLIEELDGLDIARSDAFPWHEPDARVDIVRRLSGGSAFAADDDSNSLPALPKDFVRLRYSLTEAEVEGYRALGRDAAQALETAVRAVEAGMTEAEVAGLTAKECLSAGIVPVVLLVAADERIRSWRHPVVKDVPVEQCAMVVICGRRRGLVAAGTRLVHFGEMSDDLAARHRAVCAVDATMMAATVPGVGAAQVFAEAQAAYATQGYPDEWQLHHQGGAIGYQPREYIANPSVKETVQEHQAFAWNPSIRGTKSEDTVLVTADGHELLTAPGEDWPVIEAETDAGVFPRADILVKSGDRAMPDSMSPRERLIGCVKGEPVDRLPFILFWGPWAETVRRWREEGMKSDDEWRTLFGFDPFVVSAPVNCGICPPFPFEVLQDEGETMVCRDENGVLQRARKDGTSMSEWLDYPVKDRATWEEHKHRFDPDTADRFHPDWERKAAELRDSDVAVALGVYPYGFFGGARTMMGAVECLIACATDPELIEDINATLGRLWESVWTRVFEEVHVDAIMMWEDMASRNGSLISPTMFRRFMTPHYRRLMDLAERHGAAVRSVDNDGLMHELTPLFLEGGINCVYPYEVQADNDVPRMLSEHPDLCVWGHMDKRAMTKDRAAIDAEIERVGGILPMGRFIPDHLIPPDVSWENFQYFVWRWKELTGKED